MNRSLMALGVAAVAAGCPHVGYAQSARPVPYPVTPSQEYVRALEGGTRSVTGAPGAGYWQQWTEYDLAASLDTGAKRLEVTARLRYHNRSPDSLDSLFLHAHQNLHAPGAERNRRVEVTDGVKVSRVVAQGTALDEVPPVAFGARSRSTPGYRVDGTIIAVRLPRPLASGSTVDLEFAWAFTIPQSGAGRMGWSRADLFHLAYWYPQMAVYDDVVGWQRDPYLGDAEFAAGFGTYRLSIDVPHGWVVRATGTLTNAAEVLAEPVRRRLEVAARSDTVVHVLTASEFGPGRATVASPTGRLTWRFAADTVRDVAFSVTRSSLWDATRTPVGDRNGDGQTEYARIETLWRETAPMWNRAWRYAQHSIEFLSRFTGLPYPWPHMTMVEGDGIRGGGMEYPMMTLIDDYRGRSDTSLYAVTAHELAHMWVPMQISNDERRHAWMDEGTTDFNDLNAQAEFFPGSRAMERERERYLARARAGTEGELMRYSDYHYPGRSGTASYQKPAALLVALRGLLGEETFLRAYRRYLADWQFKHPHPWDFFNSFNHTSGRNLDWFWRTWYYETWTMDHAIAQVRDGPEPVILVEDRGLAPMPARLTISLGDGSILFREVPVDRWLAGHRTAEVTLPAGTVVMRVELDAEHQFPDTDRGNDVWMRVTR